MTDTPSHADTLNALETLLQHPHITADLEPELRNWKSHVEDELSARRAADDALGAAFRRRLTLDMSSVSNDSLAWAIWCALDDVNARVVPAAEADSNTPVGYVHVRDVPEEDARLGDAIRARDAAEIKSEESRQRVAAAEVELDAARSALESRVLLDVLDDDEVQAKIQIRIAYALAKVFGAFGIDLDNPPVITEPDGWIVGSVQDSDIHLAWANETHRGRAGAEAELAQDRAEHPEEDLRLYEVREVRS